MNSLQESADWLTRLGKFGLVNISDRHNIELAARELRCAQERMAELEGELARVVRGAQLALETVTRHESTIKSLEGELAKWKEGCERNADCYRDAVRKQDEQRLAIKSLESQVEMLKEQLRISDAGWQFHNKRANDMMERGNKLESELAQFHAALEREKSPKWSEEHKRLATELETIASRLHPGDENILNTAARELRYMADSFCLKANFVPSNLALKAAREAFSNLMEGDVTGPFDDNWLQAQKERRKLAKEAIAQIDRIIGGEKL